MENQHPDEGRHPIGGFWTNANALVHASRMAGLTLFFFVFVGARGIVSSSGSRHLTVQWNVPVTSPGGSLLHWYELKADPEDGNNLIVCGARRDAQDNAYYGVVYFSHDGGRSWKTALEDHRSTWVSEQSCAFGKRHDAYFISESSRVIDGRPHHELGTTHVFMSSDAGESWEEARKTSWADYSSSTFGNPPGSAAGRLYVIYQDLKKVDGTGAPSNALGFFTVSEDGKRISAHKTIPGTEGKYRGIYPTSAVTLGDGTPIVLFDAGLDSRPANGLMRFHVGVVRFNSSGPTKPIVIATHRARYQTPTCPATLSNSLAYDGARGWLYAAYNDAVRGRCAIMLTHSQDGGQTWSTPQELSGSEAVSSSRYFPLLAVNEAGVLGLLWRGNPGRSPGCWYFSISRDGLKLNDTVPLSPCRREDSLRDQSSAYLATIINQADAHEAASVQVLSFRDRLLKAGITASPDGVFHPLWSALGDGDGELRTARITIGQPSPSVPSQPIRGSALEDVTDKFTVLYGGEQRIDHETKSLMLDISFRNRSSVSIPVPLYLTIGSAASDFGDIKLINSVPRAFLWPDNLDFSPPMRTGALAPGETTAPYHLVFHFADENHSRVRKNILLEMKVRLFSQE